MINDIFNKQHEIKINDKTLKIEFDNAAYAKAEQVTNQGLFSLYNELIVKSNLSYSKCVEVLCCGLMKHNDQNEILEVKKQLEEKKFLLMQNMGVLSFAFAEPLMPPEIIEKTKKKAKLKKQTKTSIG